MSTLPRLSNLAVSLENGVALLKYNRPDAGNALNTPLFKVFIVRFTVVKSPFFTNSSSGHIDSAEMGGQ